MFHVVCIDDSELVDDETSDPSGLSEGTVYTVTGEFYHYGWCFGEHALIHCYILAEILNPFHPDGGFAADRFRPLSSTRLEVFRQLLVSPKERVGA